jgi:tetratricopeptide (TPR) repeat protein
MNSEQLLKQVFINRELILQQSANAHEHLEMLQREYAHLIKGEVAITLEMNKALSELYFNSDYAKAMEISIAAIERFKNSPYHTPLAFHMKMVSTCHMHLGENDLAERYLLEALETLSPDDKDYITNRADMFYSLAQAEEAKDRKSPKMADYLLQALSLLSADTDSVRKANCLLGLGNYYINIENPKEALRHFEEAVIAFEKRYLLQHMSNCYSNMGTCYLMLQDFENAEKYMQKALDLRVKSGSPDNLAISYSNFGRLYKSLHQLDKAEEFVAKSQSIAEEIGFKQLIERNNTLLDEIALERKEQSCLG